MIQSRRRRPFQDVPEGEEDRRERHVAEAGQGFPDGKEFFRRQIQFPGHGLEDHMAAPVQGPMRHSAPAG